MFGEGWDGAGNTIKPTRRQGGRPEIPIFFPTTSRGLCLNSGALSRNQPAISNLTTRSAKGRTGKFLLPRYSIVARSRSSPFRDLPTLLFGPL